MDRSAQTLESLLLKVLVEMDKVKRDQTQLRIEDSIRSFKLVKSDREIDLFVQGASALFENWIEQGICSFTVTSQRRENGHRPLHVVEGGEFYVFGH